MEKEKSRNFCLRLPESVYEKLREKAFKERKKMQEIILDSLKKEIKET